MASNKPAIRMEMDMDEGYALLGHIEGIASAIDTDRYIGSVIKYSHNELAKVFDAHMDLAAVGNPSAYHHVYEWRMVGLPQGRLWKHKLSGGGVIDEAQGRVREATFQFLSSTRPILNPEERKSDPLRLHDPMANVPMATIAKLHDRKYIFYAKASMMEYGLSATVLPRYSKFLFVPNRRGSKGTWSLMEMTQQNFTYANPQDHSGGAGTVGRFTKAWVDWWGTTASKLWDDTVRHTIENDLGKSEAELKKTVRARPKQRKVMGIGVFKATSGHAAFESGKNLAEAYIFGKAKSYVTGAKHVDQYGTYGGVFE